MEELEEKVEQVLTQVAGQPLPTANGSRIERRSVLAKLRDGRDLQVELSGDALLGISEDDRDKLAEHLRVQGLDVEAVEAPRPPQAGLALQWAEALSQAFAKAWVARVDVTDFCELVCKCGERLLGLRRYSLAYQEVFYRYCDRAVQLRAEVGRNQLGEVPSRKVSVVSRYYLGASYALYLQTIHRDGAAQRSDTVDLLRDVLRDILQSVQILSSQSEAVREELYWCLYNSSLLVMRIARWLRLHGFGGICVQPLWLLVESMQTCLPLMGVHMIPFRARLMMELAYCAESGKQLGEAKRVCDVAEAHFEKAKKLETMLPPVPAETLQVFEVQLSRFKLLRGKYEFWLGKLDVSALSTRIKELAPAASVVVSALVESLQFLHGLPQHFGAEEGKNSYLDGVPAEGSGELELTTFTNAEVQAKQSELLGALVQLIQPLAQQTESATEELEAHTLRRLTWEAEAERRARTDEPKVDENGEEVPPDPRPVRPDEDALEGMGFPKGARMHGFEEALSMEAHVWLAEQGLRQEMRGSEANKGSFELLEKCLALRLRYRHFLRPPLVDVDVLVNEIEDPEKVRLPESYELLTGDLNHFSPQNLPGDGAESGATKKQGKHVYVIGQRFDAWENWTAEYPVPIRRLCNMKVAFLPQAPPENRGPPPHATGMHEKQLDGEEPQPWLASYRSGSAGDSSGFEVLEESEQLREALLKQLTKDGLVTHRALEVPVDPHPGSKGKTSPFLFFSVYDERTIWCVDGQAQKEAIEPTAPLDDATLLPEAAATEQQANSEKLLPPWSPLMDAASLASHQVLDLACLVTKHMHACAPSASFNGLLRTDLRQTPGELRGKPFQSYVLLAAAVEAPSPALATRRLRILRALHSLWKAKAAGDDFFSEEKAPPAEGEEPPASPKGRWKRPEIMDRLLDLADCLERTAEKQVPQNQLFLLAAPDFLEDVCTYTFLTFAWPKICYMQDILQQHELKERVLKDQEKNDISEWSHVLRRLLPLLLRTLEKVHTVDALTLGSAGFALAQLFWQENDCKSAQRELGCAILRLEGELGLAATPGPQARLDVQTAGALSFDPPSMRPPNFALFHGEIQDQGASPAGDSPPASPTSKAVDVKDADAAMILQSLPRLQQDRLCLLARLYESWIDCSLATHLPHHAAPVRRKMRPNEVPKEVDPDETSMRLALSSQEARVLGRLGENPYLRCYFFVSVARRRPEVATAALHKAVAEADGAVAQERNLWAQQEQELLRQQKGIRKNEQFCKDFRKAGRMQRKPAAHLPVVVARMPGRIQLRLPPVLSSPQPPLLPISSDLHPPAQEYSQALHSKRLGTASPSQTSMTCTVFGKAAGVGTAVSEMHKDLHGTGARRAGQDLVEITGLKPNTNYCFATMYYEGFESTRPVLSSMSSTSPPIGAYFPLPVAMLRVKLCKAALSAGELGAAALRKAWGPLFESFAERCALEEEFESYGLRTFKLRLDVADRFPPTILSAFAELVLLRHRLTTACKKGAAFPCTRPAQRAVLVAANECAVAVDCARRAGTAFLTRSAVSMLLELLAQLLCYRTKPAVLLSALAKCVAVLESFPWPERQLPWHSQARQMVMCLLHQVTVMCVQLGQVNLLQKQLTLDLPERYVAHARAEGTEEVQRLLLDQATELALLGPAQWVFAEKKALVALQDSPDKDELVRLLKELSNKNFTLAAKDAAVLSLREDPERPLLALSLLRCAATHGDGSPEMMDSVASVLSKHRCCKALEDLLRTRQQEYKKYTALLRALPPARLKFEEPQEEEKKEEGEPVDEATLLPEEPEAVEEVKLEEHLDTELLSQLELSKAAALMKELQTLQVSRHAISRFKFLDLKQVTIPLLPPDGATLGVYEAIEEEPEETVATEEEPSEWQKQEEADKEAHARGFQILEELLRLLARSAGYAAARQADQLLQASLVTALNALLLVAPTPEECVPQGAKSNPMDIDPDRYVGAEEEKGDEEAAAEPETDIWLSLALISEFAIDALKRLKEKLAVTDTRKESQASKDKDKQLDPSEVAAKELEAAGEELHDLWFEKMPELDVASSAKVVAFSVLCLYHMRRWSNIIVLCRGFNDSTCAAYATTFLPLMIGAQKEVQHLSGRAVANTQRYLAESKATFEADQKKLPRKLLRQLALQGELSEPEKLFKKRSAYYDGFQKRQQQNHGSWSMLLKAMEDLHSLLGKAVPAAAEQLRKSRLLLAEFLHDREAFSIQIQRQTGKDKGQERALRLAASALVSSYRKAVELLRKRQMNNLVVEALHELGNLLWLEGDVAGARDAWSDAVDTVFQFPYAIKNSTKCMEASLSPPQDSARVEILLLSVVLLAKHARLTRPKDMMAHLNAALFASSIIEAILTTSLPNPSRREQFARFRLREIFFGLRETRMIMPPSSVYGGVDGSNFLNALGFFLNTFMVMDYQPARCLPICALYNYIATDVCRNAALATKGRLLTVQALLRCRSFTEAWLALYSLSRGHDQPKGLVEAEALDTAVVEAQEMAAAEPFRQYEEPSSEANVKAINQLMEFTLPEASGSEAFSQWLFKYLKAEFLVTVCSYQRVFPKMNEPQEKDRLVLLDKADALLVDIWKEMTGNADDREAWSNSSRTFRETGGEEPTFQEPTRPLPEEEGELCAEVRLMRGKIQEGQGDLGKAIQEVLYGMEFLRRTARTVSCQECKFGSGSSHLRPHPGSKCWMRLRCYMVHLLIGQGRLKAASAHIQQGLEETRSTLHDVARVELLMAKVRVEVLSGRLLELQGARHLGAVPAAECCLALARRLPMPTPGAVYARMMLCTVLQQNPSLCELRRSEENAEALEASGGAEEEVLDPSEMLLLEAAGSIIISPIAKQLQKKNKDKDKASFHEQQKLLADLVAQSLQDVDNLLSIMGLQMAPRNVNSYCDFGEDGSGSEAFKPLPDPPLLPKPKASFCKLSHNDSRELPSIYLELMPLRLHCQLELAALRLNLGLIDEACELLQEAELSMTRCVHLLPWQYVQFCLLKLRWRRLKHGLGLATSAPLDAPNAVLYRDPKTFGSCICPATDSPLYRTFLERAKPPQIAQVSEWVPPYERKPQEALQLYMQEFVALLRLALKEGGNDLPQLLELLDEGLEEVLRTEVLLASERPPGYQQIYPFFACFAAVAKCRKALLFTDNPKGAAGPPAVDAEKLPLRVALGMQRHLQRQAAEGALAYSAAALQTVQKQILFRSMMRQTIALRRECDVFGSLFSEMRLLTDQLHVALSQCCEAYVKARVLDEALLKTLEAPDEVPSAGVFVRWAPVDLRAQARPPEGPAPCELMSLLIFFCPEGEESQPLIARSVARLAAVQTLAEGLAKDLRNCRPAKAVATDYVEQRLREVARVLRPSLAEDERLEAALQQLLLELAEAADAERPVLLKSELVQAAVQAMILLLDPHLGAAQVSHKGLARFLRAVFAPSDLFQ